MGAERPRSGLPSRERARRGRRARGPAVRAPAARRPPPAQPLGPLRPPGPGARPSPALPSPPGRGLRAEPGQGREPRDECLRWVRSGMPGGGEAGRAGAWVRPADRPRVEMERGRPGCGARLSACLGPRRSCPSSSTPPRPPPFPLGTPCPSCCPRPPHPSCCLSPVHLPSRPRAPAPSPSPGRTPAQSYLLRTQHQICLAPSAPICPSLSSAHLSPQLCSSTHHPAPSIFI